MKTLEIGALWQKLEKQPVSWSNLGFVGMLIFATAVLVNTADPHTLLFVVCAYFFGALAGWADSTQKSQQFQTRHDTWWWSIPRFCTIAAFVLSIMDLALGVPHGPLWH